MRPTQWLAFSVVGGSAAMLGAICYLGHSDARVRAQSQVGHVIELTPEADTWYEVSNPRTGAPVNATPQGANAALQAGWWDVGIDEYALMRFAVPTTLPGHVVDRAELELGVFHAAILTFRPPSPVSGTMTLNLHPVGAPWEEATLTSLTPPDLGLPVIRAAVDWGPCGPEDCGTARIDVTTYVRGWMTGGWQNGGMALHASGVYDPIMGTIYAVYSRESNRPSVLRIVEIGADDLTPPPWTPTVEQPTPDVRDVLWVPVALNGERAVQPTQAPARATASCTPTETPTPAETPTPTAGSPTSTPEVTPTGSWEPPTGTPTLAAADRYLLLERWASDERGPGCPFLFLDLPMYDFDPSTGVLYTRLQPQLEAGDVGYYGSGRSLNGQGSGISSVLQRIESLPFGADDINILAVSDRGGVTVTREGETYDLAAGGEKRWQWARQAEAPGCMITTTLRITNFGFQDRAKIRLYPLTGRPL